MSETDGLLHKSDLDKLLAETMQAEVAAGSVREGYLARGICPECLLKLIAEVIEDPEAGEVPDGPTGFSMGFSFGLFVGTATRRE